MGRRAGSPPDGGSGRSHGGTTQLVFRRQGKTVKKRDSGSPSRTEETWTREPRQSTKGNSSKKSAIAVSGSGAASEDVQSMAERVADEPLRNLRLLRERAQSSSAFLSPDVAGGTGGAFLLALTTSLERLLGRARLGADLGSELLSCLAALGESLPTLQARGLVEWLLDSYDLSISDESRVLLLRALLEVLKNNTAVATAMLPVVMERSQTMLENADECELLLATADVTLWCAQRDPDTFVTRYLRDTADILVGWHIDVAGPQQNASCYSARGRRPGEALEVLEALGPLWAADGAFCATLLAQFVEDLCAYAEEPSSDALDRMGALLRVHAALLRSLGLQAAQLLSWDLLSNNLHNMLTCIMTAVDYYPSEPFLLAANDALGPLCGAARECPSSIVDLVGVEVSLARESESLALSLLWLLGTLVASLGPQFPISLVGPALGHPWAQGSPRPRIQKALLALQHRLLRVKSVPLLQEAYGCLLEAVGALRGGPKELQPHCLGALCALAELANMRHSIIGMWALDPTLFELVTEHLCPTDAWLGEHRPALQYALLRLLHTHCTRHGHFVSTSVLVTGAEAPSSGGHLSCLLHLLGKLLPVGPPKVSHSSRMLALEWVAELAEAVRPYVIQLTGAEEFLELVDAVVQAGFSHEAEVSLKSCQTLQSVLDQAATALPAKTLQRAYELCVLKLGSPEAEEREAFGALLCALPVDVITSRLTSPEAEFLGREWSGAVSMPPDVLGTGGLRAVLRALLLGTAASDETEGGDRPFALPWGAPPTALSHEGVQWGRALWGAAQLCVQGKLRTPLGKPQDTFSALEGAIKSLLAKPVGGLGTLKRAHLLLDFLEHLERAMYNAYEGSAGSLPSVGRAVRAFFRTNRATCAEWVGRVRPHAARLALRAGRPATAFRHASLALSARAAAAASQDLKHQDLPLLLDAADALILLRCPDALAGLQAWSKTSLEKELPWLEAAECHAAGRFESAAERYASLLAEGACDGARELRPFLLQQMVECHRLLGNWQEALRWAEGEALPTNGYVGHGTYQQRQQQFLTLHFKFLSDSSNGDSSDAGTLCVWDGWSAAQQTLLVQHRALHGCGDAAASAAELLRLRMLEWPPDVHPVTVAALRPRAENVGLKLVGRLLPPLHCCGTLGNAFANCDSSPALLAAARLARKQTNLRLAHHWVLQAAAYSGTPFAQVNAVEDLEEHPDQRVAYEAAKLLQCTGKRLLAARTLARVASRPDQPPEMAARALVTLARWRGKDSSLDQVLGEVLALPPFASEDCLLPPSTVHEKRDASPVGALLWPSVGRCPTLDKAWAALGAHAYTCGGGLDAHSEGKLPLSAEEDAELEELLPDTLEAEECSAVCQLLTRIPAWGDRDTRESLESLCPSLPEPARDALLGFHARLLRRATGWHQVALRAYCRYLHLGPTEGEGTTTAALRVVRLAARLGPLLGPCLQENLTMCPTRPWKSLVPQLLSLLAHPEDSVRSAMQRLLEQVGREAPHLLLFPVTVEALGPSSSSKTAPKPSVAATACAALLNTLAVHAPDAVMQVESFVRELRRIAVLWDELCLGALSAHSGEAHRRIRTLEEEVGRVRSNATLSSEDKDALIKDKHAVFLRPTICLLEELCEATRGPPETPHEVWFRETLRPFLEETLEAVRNPQDPGRPQATWVNVKRLHLRLQRRSGAAGTGTGDHPSANPPLLMERVSPALAELSDSQVPMPGCGDGEVQVTAVLRAIQVLPTKTKPKKLAFQGSDGRKYTFLFKGMEDLHLDERLMQLLGVVNAMLARAPTFAPLRARRYAVTPLGPRSGLIQWLDGVTPLFSLYKRWQQRESATPLRPSEIFYGKLTPLLKEQGITNLENRREWPMDVLVETLEALMAETPRDLVAKELWLAAPSAPQWWRSTCAFCASTAVMSIVGYVIGLGDRHLDNVLLDLHAGEVVHIDYNVCFEKGRQLRVPEKVPFRMTPNLEAALGMTGVEGQFRLACQHVLQVLRDGSEPLLSLLEALVWDPLVSWGDGGSPASGGPSSNGGGGEKGLAKALLSLRLREGAPQWEANATVLNDALEELEGLLEDCQQAQSGVQGAEQRLEEACAQQTLVEEALASEDHSLRSLPQRQQERLLSRMACDAACSALGEKLQECCTWGHLQEAAFTALRGPQLERWTAALTGDVDAGVPESPVAPLGHFLHSSGQGQLMQQCEQREAELRMQLAERRRAMRSCVDLMRAFGVSAGHGFAGGAYLPQRLRQQRWQHWLQGLAQDFSLAKCQEVISEFHHVYGVGADLNFVQVVLQQQYELQSSVADLGARILAVLERKQAEGTDYLPEAQAALLALAEGGTEEVGVREALVGALCRATGALLSLERVAAEDPRPWTGEEAPLPLEDLCSQAALLLQLADLLPHMDPRPEVLCVCRVVETVNNVFSAMLDLSLHFETIIVPESLQRAADASVVALAASLQALAAPQDLEEQLAQLHTHGENIQHSVASLREKFQCLLENNQTSAAGLSPGQMLLLGFNGLFAKLGRELATLHSALEGADLRWNNVDVVWGARALCHLQLDRSSARLLEDTLFVHSLCVMQQFFCCQLPTGSRDQMLASVRFFLADFYRNQVAGLPTLCTANALCALTGCSDRERPVSLESLASPSSHPAVASLEASAARRSLLGRLDRAQLALQGRLQRAQAELSAHQWLHQDLLPAETMAAGAVAVSSGPSRPALLAELRKAMCCTESSVQESWEAQGTLWQALEQRLRWATGANPSLAHTQQHFAQLLTHWEQHLQGEETLVQEIHEACEGLLQLEAQRPGSPEAQAWDGALLALLNRCQESCLLLEGANMTSAITTVEEQLLELVPPPEAPSAPSSAIADWLRTLLGKVDLGASRKQLEEAKATRDSAKDALQAKVLWLRGEVLSQHHKLMSEVRSILKALARQEGDTGGPVQEYLSLYRGFSDRASQLVRDLLANPVAEMWEPLGKRLIALRSLVPKVYQGLTALVQGHETQKHEDGACDPEDPKTGRDPQAKKGRSDHKNYALGVWKRVKTKLDGRDPDPSRCSSVEEQVDFVIGEATRLENLALLYEGWTPWV